MDAIARSRADGVRESSVFPVFADVCEPSTQRAEAAAVTAAEAFKKVRRDLLRGISKIAGLEELKCSIISLINELAGDGESLR